MYPDRRQVPLVVDPSVYLVICVPSLPELMANLCLLLWPIGVKVFREYPPGTLASPVAPKLWGYF